MVIDKVVPGKELVKIENPEVAVIDEALDEEEREVEELQRILDQEEEENRQKEVEMIRQKEKQMNLEKEEEIRRKDLENSKLKDSECQSDGQRYMEEEGGSRNERCPEKEKDLEKDASLEIPFSHSQQIIGGRPGFKTKYTAHVTPDGILKMLDATLYIDCGSS